MAGHNKRFESQELDDLLRLYWLVGHPSVLGAGVKSVVKAYENRLKLHVVCAQEANSKWITKTLDALDIDSDLEVFTEYEKVKRAQYHVESEKDCLLLKVPALCDRVDDFEALLPLAFEYANKDEGAESHREVFRVEGTSLISMLLLLKFGRYSLLEIIKSMIRSAENGVIWGTSDLTFEVSYKDLRSFLRLIPSEAALYTGLGLSGASDRISSRAATELYSAEYVADEILSISGFQKFDPVNYSDSKKLELICKIRSPISFDLSFLRDAARNFAYHFSGSRPSISNPAQECLALRMQGWTEGNICRHLIDGSNREYRQLLEANKIALESCEDPENHMECYTLESWHDARDRLFSGYHSPPLSLSGLLSYRSINEQNHRNPAIARDRSHREQSQVKEDSPVDPKSVKDQYIFKDEGATWRVSFGGETKSIKDSKGMTYICRLLQNPGQDIHALLVENPGLIQDRVKYLSSAGEVIDRQAIIEYKIRIAEINEELTVAKSDDDQSRISNLEQEQRMLLSELQKAVGHHGGIRKALSARELARKRVSIAIGRAMNAIEIQHKPLWQHLKNSLSLGEKLSYRPDRSINWIT